MEVAQVTKWLELHKSFLAAATLVGDKKALKDIADRKDQFDALVDELGLSRNGKPSSGSKQQQ